MVNFVRPTSSINKFHLCLWMRAVQQKGRTIFSRFVRTNFLYGSLFPTPLFAGLRENHSFELLQGLNEPPWANIDSMIFGRLSALKMFLAGIILILEFRRTFVFSLESQTEKSNHYVAGEWRSLTHASRWPPGGGQTSFGAGIRHFERRIGLFSVD